MYSYCEETKRRENHCLIWLWFVHMFYIVSEKFSLCTFNTLSFLVSCVSCYVKMLQGWILIHVTHNIYYKYEKNIKGKGHKRDYVTVLKIDDSSMRPLWLWDMDTGDVYTKLFEMSHGHCFSPTLGRTASGELLHSIFNCHVVFHFEDVT